jgi:hypothetical protein
MKTAQDQGAPLYLRTKQALKPWGILIQEMVRKTKQQKWGKCTLQKNPSHLDITAHHRIDMNITSM